jgi:RNA polymerase-binding protein DksA
MQLEIIKHHLRRPARYEAKGCRFFRALLEGRKRAILQKQSARWGSMNQKTPDWMADAADRATPDRTPIRCAIEIGNGSCSVNININAAFARINGGDYGLSEHCGAKIGLARLKVRPVNTLCIGCKSAQEARAAGPLSLTQAASIDPNFQRNCLPNCQTVIPSPTEASASKRIAENATTDEPRRA